MPDSLSGFKFFDSMEGDLSKVAAEDLLNTENGLLSLLANLYSQLPGIGLSDNDKNQFFGAGARDLPSYGNTVSGFWNYTAVRAVNVFLQAVEEASWTTRRLTHTRARPCSSALTTISPVSASTVAFLS